MKEKDFGSICGGITCTVQCRYSLVRVLAFITLFLFVGKNNQIYAQEDTISTVVDNPPKFNGDFAGVEFQKYVISTMIYPKEAIKKRISGRVVVEFAIDVDGSLVDAKVKRKAHRLLNAEALRVINSSPKWSPGIQKGKPVKVKYVYPINFNLPR